MFTHMADRPYTLKKRAESQEATRRRIVEAAMRLHEKVGPKNTTISAVAELAGVQRLTVYRHFTDETALFEACTSHWLSLHPPPDPQEWSSIEDGPVRCRSALLALYRYYRGTRRMWTAAYRDETDVEALRKPMKQVRVYLASIADGLAAAFPGVESTPKQHLSTTLHHCVAFPTWASLSAQGLNDEECTDVAVKWVSGVLQPEGP
jgi:AcrR family transcriptional regulator